MRYFSATIALLLALLAGPTGWLADSHAGGKPPAHWVLVLDKTACGEIRSVTGGTPAGKPVTFRVDVPLHKTLVDWIVGTFNRRDPYKNGSIMGLDSGFLERSRLEFSEAVVTELALPALEAASKDVGHLTLTLQPETARAVTIGKDAKKQATGDGKAKPWVIGNYRLDILGLDCTQVRRIEPIAVRQNVKAVLVGASKKPQLVPTRIEFPNLKVTLTEKTAKAWLTWQKDFALKGMGDKKLEKSGSLTLLSADHKQVLATLGFKGLGIVSLAKKTVKGENQVMVEMFVDDITFAGAK